MPVRKRFSKKRHVTPTNSSLEAFLASKPLYYKEIDHLRVHHAYAMLKPHIRRPETIHIVGTNGKGSTGRIMAHLAYTSFQRSATKGKKKRGFVGHYTSPHILRFNERIWIDGRDANDATLEAAHRKLYGILGQEMSEALSYFEYTTLLAFTVFEHCELMVLEAGLGGEFDATNVCNKELSVVTPIGLDHQAFLGESIEAIAETKLRSIQKRALLAPQPYDEVYRVAAHIAKEKGAELFISEVVDIPHLSATRYPLPTATVSTLKTVASEKGWPDFLVQNAIVAMQALELTGIAYDVDDLRSLELFGRFYPFLPNVRIDVGHNPLAAQALVEAMEEDSVLIYNSLDDKDYETVLRILKPKLKRVELIPIESQRAATLDAIEAALRKLDIPYTRFETIHPDEHYVVFGSFYTVEAFLKNADAL